MQNLASVLRSSKNSFVAIDELGVNSLSISLSLYLSIYLSLPLSLYLTSVGKREINITISWVIIVGCNNQTFGVI